MATGVFDLRLIDPTETELTAALQKAQTTANRQTITRLDRDRAFWLRFARDCRREPQGRRRSCRADYRTPEVIAGWWTDPASRKHFRVIGRTRWRDRGHYYLRGEGELRDLPPWWHVYPESVVAVRQADGSESYLACCRCGNTGTPESLGWMGDTCGPCFDRRAEGGVPAGGFGQFNGWASAHHGVGFSFDGSRLIGMALPNKVRVVERVEGAEVRARCPAPTGFAASGTPGGFLIGWGDGSVSRWNDGDAAPARVLPRPAMFGRQLIDPTGRWSILIAYQQVGFTADLTADRPRHTAIALTRNLGLVRFNATGTRIYSLGYDGELLAIDPATLRETGVRTNVFNGLPRYTSAREMVVAPDESAIAVVCEVYQPQSHIVRMVPLLDGPTYDLPVPPWHRPSGLAFTPDSRELVTLDPRAGWVGFWRLPSGKAVGFVRARLEAPAGYGGQIGFSPDGSALLVVYSGGHAERGSTAVIWPWPQIRAASSA